MAEISRRLLRFQLTSSFILEITKLHSEPPYGGVRGNISALSEIFNERNYVAEFYRQNVSFIRKTAK